MMRPTILAIDPGSAQSAFVLYVPVGPPAGWEVRDHGKIANDELLRVLRGRPLSPRQGYEVSVVAIEQIEPRYGLQAGWEVLDTARWVGRFEEAAQPFHVVRLTRSEILTHLGVVTRGKDRVSADAGTRAALIDRFGGTKEVAIGVKASPGPLYGIRADEWAAIAVAVTYQDRDEEAFNGAIAR